MLSALLPGTGTMRFYPLIQGAPFIFLLALRDNSQILLDIKSTFLKIRFDTLLIKKIIIMLGIVNILFIFSSSTAYQFHRTQTYINFANEIKNEDPLAIKFGGWIYHRHVLEKLGVTFSDNHDGLTCLPLKSEYKVHIHDEVTLCK